MNWLVQHSPDGRALPPGSLLTQKAAAKITLQQLLRPLALLFSQCKIVLNRVGILIQHGKAAHNLHSMLLKIFYKVPFQYNDTHNQHLLFSLSTYVSLLRVLYYPKNKNGKRNLFDFI